MGIVFRFREIQDFYNPEIACNWIMRYNKANEKYGMKKIERKEEQNVMKFGELCSCGKVHQEAPVKVITCKGAIMQIPACVREYHGKKAFVFADKNTYEAAGKQVCAILEKEDIPYTLFLLDSEHPNPDEYYVGSLIMHFDYSCDFLIGVGSGVINDLGKIISNYGHLPYMIVATAPSMDGYCSETSSVTRSNLKYSLPSRSADIIIGDVDILKNAPLKMLQAGVGDMVAKYISIGEWRIGHLLTGEYYCEEIADLVRKSLKQVVDHAEKLMQRDEDAVKIVFEGLVLSALCMNYAGVSRPAAGIEHNYSHIWDMRSLETANGHELHGIQCAVGTVYAAKIYDQIKKITPDREKALAYAAQFDYAAWAEKLTGFLGKSAKSMIELEAKEGKYDTKKHADRLELILSNWDEIRKIIEEEIPTSEEILKILQSISAPVSVTDIGLEEAILPMTFLATKDIRDKYILSRLAWDLGVIEELE